MPNFRLNISQLSFWERKTYFEDIDFIVVGAGIVGCSTAIHLRKNNPNAKILVLERSYLPNGASTKNAGFACFGSPTELLDDLRKMPESEVWETVQSRWEGLLALRNLIGDNNLDFQALGSWEIMHQNQDSSIAEIRSKLNYLNEKIQQITGIKDCYSEDENSIQKFGFQNIETAFFNKLEGQIDPGKMMIRYHQLLSENNIHLLTGIEVLDIDSINKLIQTSLGLIGAKKTFLTVNGFAQKFVQEDIKPARAQVLVTSEIPNLKFKGTFHYDEGYYYFRNFENRVLIGGGRNLDFVGETTTEMQTTPQIISSLKELLDTIILPNINYTIDYQWAGIMGIGATKKPIVKQIDEFLSIGIRLGGMGVAIGTNVGKELAEMR